MVSPDRPTLEEAASRLLFIGFDGERPPAGTRRLLEEGGAGGVILFSRNIVRGPGCVRRLRDLAAELRSLSPRPLILSVDQEGGAVARLKEPFTIWPEARALGDSGDPDLARRFGRVLGEELRAVDLDLDFAPVMDVDTNRENPIIGRRALGSTPTAVARLGVEIIRGLQEAGVAACAKHFPGHGDAAADSHLVLPVVDRSWEDLRRVEIPPFEAAIRAGVDSIMTAHVHYPAADRESLPATLSVRFIERFLRQELGFGGVVFTDDLEMKGIEEGWPAGRAAPLALAAGCDALLVCHDLDKQLRAREGVLEAAARGELAEARIFEAAGRIEALTDKLGLAEGRPPGPEELAGAEEHRYLSRLISRFA